jgi:hypothetical protein
METTDSICSYGTPVPFEKGRALAFADFSLVFDGYESRSYPGGPTVSLQVDHFTVTGPSGVEQRLDVVFGQRPPQPLAFEVNEKAFTLFTFLLPDGTRLEKGHLAVLKARSHK